MKTIFATFTAIFFSISLNAQVVTKITPNGKENDIKFNQCHFKLHDFFSGRVRVYLDEKPQYAYYKGPLLRNSEKSEVSLNLSCRDISKVELRDCGLDLKDGKLHTSGTDGFTEAEKKEFHEELIPLTGKNWKGSGVQSEYTIQSHGIRAKEFTFCLKHNDLVLTGSATGIAEVNKPSESALPNIIKLLESVEFIDDVPVQ